MQAGADTVPHPIAFPERFAVAAPVDPPERHLGEPKSQPKRQPEEFPHTDAVTCGSAHHLALELA
jgi:hypothetical protein